MTEGKKRSNQGVLKQPNSSIQAGPFHLEMKTQQLYKDGKLIKLTVREFQLIKLFLNRFNEQLSRNYLLDEIWGQNYFGDSKTVDVHIRRLREKIEDNPSQPVFLKTIWGVGYCFQNSKINK